MSNTPRTDAAAYADPTVNCGEDGFSGPPKDRISIEFARQLERELADCAGKYDALVKILERKQDRIDVCERDLSEAKKALKALTFPHEAVEGTWPLILYFSSPEEANGFEQAVLAAQPNLKPHQL